uniref:type IX secretion system plug protein n=1 Tax=Flavobacterium sp. TaxID=239 RepID=UPI00404AB73C
MTKSLLALLFLFLIAESFSQVEEEVAPPYKIKTISFTQNGNNIAPFIKLGEQFEIQFDDLYGDESDYYYTITQCNYDWTQTALVKAEYLNGMDNQRIINYENSFNTLQLYSYYRQSFPNTFNSITKSGNYILKILNEEQEVVFSRKFVIYEDLVGVSLAVKRPRDFEFLNEKQNMELIVDYGNRALQNPIQNVNVTFFQNGNWKNAIHNIKPQFTLGTKLVYKYNEETQFWAGNEFYTLDNSLIRNVNNTVAKVTSGNGIYNTYLYYHTPRRNKPYTYFPDFNGNFYALNKNATNSNFEADYTWVYFTLDMPELFSDKQVYVNGMFNNYEINDACKLVFNQ